MKEKKLVSLEKFIKDNNVLLSALAVFASLTALLSKLSISWLSTFLSFLSIGGLILIWLEIRSKIPKDNISIRLLFFRYVLLWGLGGIGLYWLLAFRDIWKVGLFVPLFFLFLYMFFSPFKLLGQILTQVINWLNSLPKIRNNKIFKKVFGFINTNGLKAFLKILKIAYFIVVICLSFSYAVLLSPPINTLLDSIKNTIP